MKHSINPSHRICLWCGRRFKVYISNGKPEEEYCKECKNKKILLSSKQVGPEEFARLCMEFHCSVAKLNLAEEVKEKVKTTRRIILKDNMRRVDEGRPLSMPLHYIYEIKSRLRRRYLSKKAKGIFIPQG